jgi:hypothetical protein
VRDIWILATSSSAAGIIIIIDIILQEHEHSVVYTLSARAMRFLRPRSSIPHLCVLETDNERDQIPGIAVSQHPSISRSPLIPSSNLPHTTIKPSLKPPTYHQHRHYSMSLWSGSSSSAKINRLLLKSLASRLDSPSSPPLFATSLRSVCLDSGLCKQKTQLVYQIRHLISPKNALNRPVSALQRFSLLSPCSIIHFLHSPALYNSLVIHVAQNKNGCNNTCAAQHRVLHGMKPGVSSLHSIRTLPSL